VIVGGLANGVTADLDATAPCAFREYITP